MQYQCTPGVVMVKICGTRLLVPTHEAYSVCPNVVRLSLPAAMGWAVLQAGNPVSAVEHIFSILTKKPEDEVREIVGKVLSGLVEAGALTVREEES